MRGVPTNDDSNNDRDDHASGYLVPGFGFGFGFRLLLRALGWESEGLGNHQEESQR